jgi:hypothetical protein
MDCLSYPPVFWILPIAAFVAAVLGITLLLVYLTPSAPDAEQASKPPVIGKPSDHAQETRSS